MTNKLSAIWFASMLALVGAAATATAQDRTGAYFGLELGAFFPSDIRTDGSDTDFRDISCDAHLYPSNTCGSNPERGTTWVNRFDTGTGALAGLTLGYMLDHFRFEFEYLYRNGGDDTSPIAAVTDRAGEFRVLDESFDNLEAHHLFANVYYDFLGFSRFTPYLGVGVGWARTEVDYEGLFIRNPSDVFNADPALQDKAAAAGTITRGSQNFEETSFGYQLLVGVDYWLIDHLSLGMKPRYAEFDHIRDGHHEWDLLRSHASTTAPGGDPITYQIESNDIRFWGASLNLKYRF